MNNFERFGLHWLFHGIEAMEAKAEVLMAEAIEAMDKVADGLTERDEPPIPLEDRKKAIMHLCEETFDRLIKERAAYVAEWRRRYGKK